MQDVLCYRVIHRTDPIQVSLNNCSKCLNIIDLATIYISANISPSRYTFNYTPFSLPTRLQYSHLQIHCFNSWSRKNDLILIMTPEKQDKTLELSKHWSVDSTPARNEVIMKRTYPVKSVKCNKICSNY